MSGRSQRKQHPKDGKHNSAPDERLLSTLLDLDRHSNYARELLYQAIHDRSKKTEATFAETAFVLSGLTDLIASRSANDEAGFENLVHRAYEILQNSDWQPVGFETKGNPAYFERVKRTAAILIVRIWSSGRMLGIPIEAWPNDELCKQILAFTEEVGDRITLGMDLGRAFNENHES